MKLGFGERPEWSWLNDEIVPGSEACLALYEFFDETYVAPPEQVVHELAPRTVNLRPSYGYYTYQQRMADQVREILGSKVKEHCFTCPPARGKPVLP